MIIAKNDENKRSTLWRVAAYGSSVLIVLIAVYLLTKLFTSNPLEGSWEDEDGNLGMTIKKNGSLLVNIPELAEGQGLDVKMNYALDKEEKTITIHPDEEELERLSGQYAKEELLHTVNSVATTFNYSVDKSRLTLTEREYGEQLVLVKE